MTMRRIPRSATVAVARYSAASRDAAAPPHGRAPVSTPGGSRVIWFHLVVVLLFIIIGARLGGIGWPVRPESSSWPLPVCTPRPTMLPGRSSASSCP